jgi:ATP-binding cassette subfamily B protein
MLETLAKPISVIDRSKNQLQVSAGQMSLEHIAFTHADSDVPLFDNFNLAVRAGEKVGIVGVSGSGKTTLTKLLMRFADPTSGAITIDGTNIATVSQASLHDAIAYVPQEPLLFHRSVAENISYSKPGSSDADIRVAAKKAHADTFIKDLADGYDTLVGERGVKLSGGQRQRIAIARAILKDAPILVLDEATSALDSESEKLIQASLDSLMSDRTSVVIAHRLSTIAKLDRIIVLEHGEIVEDGSHDELLKNNGVYANLWKRQSGGFIDEG